jgi:hypothetical protein
VDTGLIQGRPPPADWRGVPAAAFAHVLDRLIDHGPGPSSTVKTAGIGTAPLLAAPFAPRWPHVAFVTMPPPVARPRRRLRPEERDALEALRRAGAMLGDDFLAHELRTAFRQIARRLHPDMHHTAMPHERKRLEARFADARAAYLVLRTPAGSGPM